MQWYHPCANDTNSNPADSKSSPRVLGGMGRMGPGRHGFLHLRPCSGSGAARPVATIGNSTDDRQHRILRRCFIRVVPGRMGNGTFVGAGGRPLWARAHLDADHPLFFGFYSAERIRYEYLDARCASLACRNRHWRRMGDRRDADFGRVAGGAPDHGRGHDAHGLLLRIFSGRAGQLFCRQPVWLEMDVRGRWLAGSAFDRNPQGDERAGALGSKARIARPAADDAPHVSANILAAIPPPHISQS